jgi:membrane protease YdiL (CAAX protease family)
LFLGVTYFLVLRHDSQVIDEHGLTLGGVFEPGPLRVRELLRSTASALGISALLCLVVFPCFWLGYQWWFRPDVILRWVPPSDPFEEVLGQVFAVALPEEVFYRGYLQSALDKAWPPKWRVLGAVIGPGLIVASIVFALGHVATTPNPSRLAVFFPSLLFGWLRARTRGVGAPIVFHAACNLFSASLARGYGFMG